MRDTVRGRSKDLHAVSLLIVYTLSKGLGISPLEILQMPQSMVMDLLYMHRAVEELKAEEMKKISKKVK